MNLRFVRAVRWAVPVAVVMACGCADSGAFNQVRFGKACEGGESCLADLGAPLAVGASEELAFELELSGSTAPALSLESIAPDVLSVEGRRLTGAAPGVAAVLVNGPDDVVVDFIHVTVAEPDGARLIRYGADGSRKGPLPESFTLLAGDEVVVGVELTAQGERLAGTVSASWSGMTDAISVVPALEKDRFRIVARQEGTAQLTAAVADFATGMNVEVLP